MCMCVASLSVGKQTPAPGFYPTVSRALATTGPPRRVIIVSRDGMCCMSAFSVRVRECRCVLCSFVFFFSLKWLYDLCLYVDAVTWMNTMLEHASLLTKLTDYPNFEVRSVTSARTESQGGEGGPADGVEHRIASESSTVSTVSVFPF